MQTTEATPIGCSSARDLIRTLSNLVFTAAEQGSPATDFLLPVEARPLVDNATPEELEELQPKRFGPPPPLEGVTYELMGLRVSWRIGADSPYVGDASLPMQVFAGSGYPETYAYEGNQDVLTTIQHLVLEYQRRFKSIPDAALLTIADEKELRALETGFSLPLCSSKVSRIYGLDITWRSPRTAVGNRQTNQWVTSGEEVDAACAAAKPTPIDPAADHCFADASVRILRAGLAEEARRWLSEGLAKSIDADRSLLHTLKEPCPHLQARISDRQTLLDQILRAR